MAYFRITAYHPKEDVCGIFDTNGLYEKLWQFSSYLIGRGFEVLEVSGEDKFLEGTISKTGPDNECHILRAGSTGKPETITHEYNGKSYHAVKIGDKIYIPDKMKIVTEDAE